MQQQPDLERILETGADQAVVEQIPLGAGKPWVAASTDPRPVREANTTGICPVVFGQDGNGPGGHVPSPERGHDQAVEAADGGPQQLAVVAQGEDDQAGAYRPAAR